MLKKLNFLAIAFALALEGRLPEISPNDASLKIKEIAKAHASHKKLSPELVKRALQNYLEELDPTKTYFILPDIDQWANPSDQTLQTILDQVSKDDYSAFFDIQDKFISIIPRRHELEKKIDPKDLPKHVKSEELKDLKWAQSEQELVDRLIKIKALQQEGAMKLSEDLREKAYQRIEKRQAKHEEDISNKDPSFRTRFTLANVLKGFASSFDTHTVYFTPDEAEQFLINVQQRLFGIGAQLRDDLNGFTIVKMVEGGPAAESKELKAKDRIIAVNGEPVVGMDISDAVELIRGEENTPVVLTIIRDVEGKEEKLDVTIKRGEVVLKETRFEASYEPFGDGVIGYVRLYSFYQDEESSSADDIAKEIRKLKDEHNLKGLILDLRSNSGGLLSQAVAVTGLFITKGIVVSIKDDAGQVQHLRDLDGKTVWDGPLMVLENRGSASASEIVAQTLQDYGRALIVGDDHTFGKGSFQTFTLNATKNNTINPQGEYKVTRGRYYTVSGKTPQLVGVQADIKVPGVYSEADVGEKFGKYPLENDVIKENFDDDLSDVPFFQREKIKQLYRFDLQKRLHIYDDYLEKLRENSSYRIDHNQNYKNFLSELKKKDDFDEEHAEEFGQSDLQLNEAYNIMKDLILLQH